MQQSCSVPMLLEFGMLPKEVMCIEHPPASAGWKQIRWNRSWNQMTYFLCFPLNSERYNLQKRTKLCFVSWSSTKQDEKGTKLFFLGKQFFWGKLVKIFLQRNKCYSSIRLCFVVRMTIISVVDSFFMLPSYRKKGWRTPCASPILAWGTNPWGPTRWFSVLGLPARSLRPEHFPIDPQSTVIHLSCFLARPCW